MDLSESKILKSRAASVLSIKGSTYAAPQEIEKNVVLLDDSRLLVARGYERDPRVESYRVLMERKLDCELTIQLEDVAEIERQNTGSAKAKTKNGPVSTMQAQIMARLRDAVARRASDIHYVNRDKYTTIRYRIDGVLRDVDRIRVEDGTDQCRTIYGSMLDQSAAEYKEGTRQDGRISREWTSQLGLTGSRVATRPLEDHNLFVIRLQYPGALGRMTLTGLGYTAAQIDLIRQMMIRNGVNLFSGSTGSGKTTSLFVVCKDLLQMHEGKINLMTVEDPIEYDMRFPFGEAVQSPLKHGETWAQAIENMMRLDPDFLMVGEIRQFEAAMAAIQGAMTGHGLWTTTHAKRAWSSLDRLSDLSVPMTRLSDATLFTGLINQSLGAVLCTAEGCAKPFAGFSHLLREDVRERTLKFCDVAGGKVRVAGAPNVDCKVCGGLGYHDRTVLAEVVRPTQALLNTYKADGSSAAHSLWVKQGGMTLVQHLIQKINAGLIDPGMGEDALHCGLDEDEITLA